MHICEALCNVGKHAVGASCLDVIQYEKDLYSLRITDNGAGSHCSGISVVGEEQLQAKELPDTCEESSRDGLTCLREPFRIDWPARPWWQLQCFIIRPV